MAIGYHLYAGQLHIHVYPRQTDWVYELIVPHEEPIRAENPSATEDACKADAITQAIQLVSEKGLKVPEEWQTGKWQPINL